MNNIVLDKQQIAYVKRICDIVPKTSPQQHGTMIHFTIIENDMIIYGGDEIKAKYTINSNNIKLENTISINAASFVKEINNNKKDAVNTGNDASILKKTKNIIKDQFEFAINNNKMRIKHDKGYTDLNSTISKSTFDIYPDNNIMPINPSIIAKMLKSIKINIDKKNDKFYIHIHNNSIRFIVNGFGRMAITSSLTISTNQDMFISCSYSAFSQIIGMFGDIDVQLSFNKNDIVILDDKFQVSIRYQIERIFTYNKYINQENNYTKITLNTSEFKQVIHSFESINTSNRESLLLYEDNNLIVCECYNPNIGSKKSTISIIDGILTRKITINISWLYEALLTITSDTCIFMYNNVMPIIGNDNNNKMPIILKSADNIHVIAPTIINV